MEKAGLLELKAPKGGEMIDGALIWFFAKLPRTYLGHPFDRAHQREAKPVPLPD